MLDREQAIKQIFNTHGTESIYITNTGYISRAVYELYPNNKNIFYMQGSMGLSPCIGLGMALNTNKNIVVLSGDASLLMHLGITHNIRDENLPNLHVYILDNGCHESVGGDECPSLEESYCGIFSIIKINNNGKTNRVDIGCIENSENIREALM
tara:strand:- start:313 stop:774 length:462 start_codon:yes stop_codon:yes gene_type:complete